MNYRFYSEIDVFIRMWNIPVCPIETLLRILKNIAWISISKANICSVIQLKMSKHSKVCLICYTFKCPFCLFMNASNSAAQKKGKICIHSMYSTYHAASTCWSTQMIICPFGTVKQFIWLNFICTGYLYSIFTLHFFLFFSFWRSSALFKWIYTKCLHWKSIKRKSHILVV